ncbi:MAG: orotidine-5'-phosphate decarboxylase [Thermoplasmata archaeon]|nr:orotidine-5'-phosphate decarboxylase [Thermoplasmata archaeon]
MTLTPRTRMIVAMDMLDMEKALHVADEVKDLVDAFKVNYPLVLSQGLGIVTELSKFGPVICDFKVADIDNTNRLIVEQAVRAGASGIICHAFMGRDALEACVKAADGKDIYVVTEMSHPGAEQFIKPIAEDLAKLAVEVGASGIIAPGTRPERIRELKDIIGNLQVLTPGIGAQGGSGRAAIDAGADFIIVGRAIYNSESPREAALAIQDDIKD